MTVKTILNLPIATSVNTSDIILVSQGGVTKQATVALVPGTTGSVSSVGGDGPNLLYWWSKPYNIYYSSNYFSSR